MNNQLTDREILRTLALASLGGALEFYDFVIFVFFTSVLGRLFFPPGIPIWSRQLQTYALFAAGYFARPVGGLIMAHFGDTQGRKRMFTLSIALMAAPTLLIAVLPTYRTVGILAPMILLLLRILQGAAIGGEAPGAWVFVAEHARAGRTGLAVGMLTSGLSFGLLLGSIVASALNILFTPAQISAGWWRAPFVLGGLLGASAAFLRRWLSETPVYLAIRNTAAATKTIPLKTVLTSYRAAIGRAFVLTSFVTGMIVVTILLAPSLIHHLFHIPARTTQVANLFGTIGLCLSTVFVGWASDICGVRRVAWLSIPFSLTATYLLFLTARLGGHHLTFWYFLAGFGAGCSVLGPIVILKLFAPEVRFTGFAFSYNIAYALFGGIAPLVVSAISRTDSFAAAHYVAVTGALGLLALTIPLPEQKTASEMKPGFAQP
jgi:MFS family permease